MAFPTQRPRRLRKNENWRRMVRETFLSVDDLIVPLFVVPGEGVRNPVASMPGVSQLSVDEVVKEAAEIHGLGIPAVILFGVPHDEDKDPEGTEAYNPDGLVPQSIRAIKEEVPDLLLWADVCMCEYTSHGHCGVLTEAGEVENDPTLDLLAQAALAYTVAGADAVAPSDMMDGRVRIIREALDAAGYTEVGICSYCCKYASAFYGPFRDALDSAPRSGDKKTYQMDPANARECLREVALDEAEGADWLMVKPGLPYADILRLVREATSLPVAAYHVSGEYAMLHAAAERGWLDYERCLLESLLCLRRAGADIIFTYAALDAARLLSNG